MASVDVVLREDVHLKAGDALLGFTEVGRLLGIGRGRVRQLVVAGRVEPVITTTLGAVVPLSAVEELRREREERAARRQGR